MTDKLLDYQLDHVEQLVYSLTSYNRALDASDTGTGKTYSSIAVCKIFGWKPLIICPKSVISSWLKVLEFMKCDFYGVSNYESIQNCKYLNSDGSKVKAKFLVREEIKRDDPLELDENDSSDDNKSEKIKYEYKWIESELPQDIIVIFDEAHRCKNIGTNNGKILVNLAELRHVKIILLSATVVDKPKYFVLTGYVLGLYEKYNQGRHWIKTVGKNFDNPMQGVHKKIYPEYASRMKISNLKNVFPDNYITAECLEMDNAIEIQAQYEIIKQVVEDLKKKENSALALAKLIYARQRIEMLKIPSFVKLTEAHIKEGKSVAIFVNFTETLKSLSEKLNTKCLIYGEQSLEERDINIENFNNDKIRIIICNIKCGATGISLHDTIGNHPRVSIISPTWSAQDMVQALGRIYRAKTKTKVIQRIIFCKGTVEDGVCENIKEKIGNIAMLNDGDMGSYQIKGLIEGDEKSLIEEVEVNNFEDQFIKLTKLYEKREMLNKEMELVKKEIEITEQLIQSQLN
jgi:superfamily II DNA or RNA helicase